MCQWLLDIHKGHDPGHLICPGSKAEEKGMLQARKRVRSTKSYFGPPVARLRRLTSARGILEGSSPVGECTDPNSDRVREMIIPYITCGK